MPDLRWLSVDEYYAVPIYHDLIYYRLKDVGKIVKIVKKYFRIEIEYIN